MDLVNQFVFPHSTLAVSRTGHGRSSADTSQPGGQAALRHPQECVPPTPLSTPRTQLTEPLAEGRLNQATLNLLEGSDIQFKRENRLDIALVKNLPIALIFLPAADIPTFVGEGQVDLGITGWDQVQEHDARVRSYNRTRRASIGGADSGDAKAARSEMVMPLDFGHCRLQVQAPTNGPYATGADLVGKTIGTSFVDLAAEHFGRLELGLDPATKGEDVPVPNKLRTKIIELSGSVEAACALGVADGIVDLVGMCRLS